MLSRFSRFIEFSAFTNDTIPNIWIPGLSHCSFIRRTDGLKFVLLNITELALSGKEVLLSLVRFIWKAVGYLLHKLYH